MNRWMEIEKKIVPDVLEVLDKRYRMLQLIRSMQPIGRRSLAQMMNVTERKMRREIDFLKGQGLVLFSSQGMRLTLDGAHLLDDMEHMMREVLGIYELEQQLQSMLSIRKVIIVPGDSADSPWIQKDLGKEAVEQLKHLAWHNGVISVTGGTTMAAVAEAMTPSPVLKSLLYVPARGGLGEELELQANTICSKMAERSGGRYRLLHIPDQLSRETYESLLFDPQIKEIIGVIRSSRIVIHGIGEAIVMAKRRKASSKFVAMLKEEQAISEAFGYFFDENGEIIHKIQTVGLRLEDVKKADHIIAVAGGKDKASAILSFLKHGIHDCLITDEGAAREMATTFN